MKLKNPKIIFSILHSGGRTSLIESIRSFQALGFPETRILVVDSGPAQELPPQVSGMGLDLIHFKVDPKAGIATCRSAGLEHLLKMDFDYVLQIDDDIVLKPDCVRHLLSAMEADPRLGLAAPVILNNQKGVLSAGGLYFRHFGQPFLLHTPNPVARSIDFATGTIGLIRMQALRETGLFDSRFDPYGFEDIDYCLRLKDMDWSIRLVPDARCVHVTSYSFHQETAARLFQTTAHRLLCGWKHAPGFWFFAAFLPWYMIRRVAYPILKYAVTGQNELAASVAKGVRNGWGKRHLTF